MIALACLASNFLWQGVPSPVWVTTSKTASWLITRDDGNGIAYVDRREVLLLSQDGKVERRVPIPSGYQPLSINEEGKLESYSNAWLSESDSTKTTQGVGPMCFAQGSSRFLLTNGITVIGHQPAHSFSEFDRSDAIGIDRSGTVLANLTSASLEPVIRVSTLVDSDWFDRPRLVAASISDVGTATTIPGYNDLVFLDKDHICFFGWIHLTGYHDLKHFEEWYAKQPDFRAWPIADQRDRFKNECSLVVTRLRDGYSYSAGKFAAESNPELRGPTIGRLASSKDQAFLYIRAEGSILRFESKSLLKFFGK